MFVGLLSLTALSTVVAQKTDTCYHTERGHLTALERVTTDEVGRLTHAEMYKAVEQVNVPKSERADLFLYKRKYYALHLGESLTITYGEAGLLVKQVRCARHGFYQWSEERLEEEIERVEDELAETEDDEAEERAAGKKARLQSYLSQLYDGRMKCEDDLNNQ